MWTISEIGMISMGMFLGILTFLDIMYQKIPLWLLISGSIIISGLWIWGERPGAFLICMGGAVGGLFLLISYATRQAFGYGDSILIIMLGISLGIWGLLQLLFYAFTLSAIFAMIQMARHHFSRKTTFPFIPFLSLAYVGVILF